MSIEAMENKDRQLGFVDYERNFVRKQTRRDMFLAGVEEVVTCSELLSMVVEPFYTLG